MKLSCLRVLLVTLCVSACLPPKAPALPEPAQEVTLPDLSGALANIVRDLDGQLGRSSQQRALVIDPLIDHAGQQTLGTRRVQAELTRAIPTAVGSVALSDFTPDAVDRAELVATGTVERELDLDGAVIPGLYKFSLSLTDRRSRLVIAHTVARFQQDDLDTTPAPFYAEAPSSAIDRPTEGYITTAKTIRGQSADEVYLSQLPTSALVAEGLKLEELGRYEESLDYYTRAAARPDGQTLRTFQGLYLANLQLNRMAAAEAAFKQLVELGIATNKLGIKMLFQPNSVNFVGGGTAGNIYTMWLRQIASAANAANACMNLVGHSSKTGAADYNLTLSRQRAAQVQSLLPQLKVKTCATGRGFEEVIIGTGTDDARDALDRRVEFQVVHCGDLECSRP